MRYTVVVTPRAEEDIYRNAAWWAEHHSLEQAIEWQNAIYAQLKALKEMPERCPLAAENPNHQDELRQLLVGLGNQRSYRAIFTIVDREVHVLTVQRGAQDTATLD